MFDLLYDKRIEEVTLTDSIESGKKLGVSYPFFNTETKAFAREK